MMKITVISGIRLFQEQNSVFIVHFHENEGGNFQKYIKKMVAIFAKIKYDITIYSGSPIGRFIKMKIFISFSVKSRGDKK